MYFHKKKQIRPGRHPDLRVEAFMLLLYRFWAHLHSVGFGCMLCLHTTSCVTCIIALISCHSGVLALGSLVPAYSQVLWMASPAASLSGAGFSGGESVGRLSLPLWQLDFCKACHKSLQTLICFDLLSWECSAADFLLKVPLQLSSSERLFPHPYLSLLDSSMVEHLQYDSKWPTSKRPLWPMGNTYFLSEGQSWACLFICPSF